MSEQQPLGSGFGAASTAAEVLGDRDLTGQSYVVTGGYSGIGVEVVRALAGAGAQVFAPARRPDDARAALAGIDGIDRVEIGAMDLADQASVAAYAETLLARGDRLAAIIGNAGVMAVDFELVGPGWELHLATNHLGHFALVNRLAPLLDRGSRVVSVASGGHHFSGIRWHDPAFAEGYDKWQAYGQSKTANVLFAVHLDRLAQDAGIRAFSLHPGAILTQLGRHMTETDFTDLLSYGTGDFAMPELKSPEAGAATAVWAATSSQLDGLGGLYLEDCDVASMAPDRPVSSDTVGVKPHALDPDEAARLWAWSVEQTGVDGFSRS